MLSVRQLEFAYNANNYFRFPDMECKKGEHWLITGPSGCGKTTYLHLMAGLLRPDKGTILINGMDITLLHAAQMDRLRGKEIGIIFQSPHFIQSLTVGENLLVVQYLNRLENNSAQVQELLSRLDIGDKFHNKPHELSFGELQRLSIARALVNHPSVIFADEPTSSLDDDNCREAVMLLRKQAEADEITLVVISHDQRLYPFFDHLIQLKKNENK